MPRVKCMTSPGEKLVKYLRGLAYAECGSLVELSDRMGISRATLYSRMRTPEKLTLEDLRAIRRSTDTSVDDMVAQIRAML